MSLVTIYRASHDGPAEPYSHIVAIKRFARIVLAVIAIAAVVTAVVSLRVAMVLPRVV
jgi:hypothetical protein